MISAMRRTPFSCLLPRGLAACRSEHASPTASQVQNLTRYPFSKVDNSDIAHFEGILSPARVLSNSDDVAGYCTDWMKMSGGPGSVVLRPTSTQEVSAIMKHCHDRNLAVVPQGGLTGLVGGSIPAFDEVVVSMSLMNKIISIDPMSGALVCQAGCVLQTLNDAVSEQGMTMPYDLGAKGSCQIGGNVATNAGGIRFLRYGSLHGSVLGLEVVLADGTVVDNLSTLRYDIKQLFIGSEGTLGVVTGVAMSTPTKPKAVTVCFVGCRTFPDVLQTYRAAKDSLGEVLSACEFLDSAAMSILEKNLGLTNPLGSQFPFYVLVEVSGSDGDHDEEKVTRFVEAGSSFENGVLATEPSKIRAIWTLRESVAEALMHDGFQNKFDISLPLENLYAIVGVMRDRVGAMATSCLGYGHLGDGNLHLNITSKEYNTEMQGKIYPFVYDWTAQQRGSISAEHGVGMYKSQYIGLSKSKAALSVMRSVKTALDPKGILNPYKVLPPLPSH